MKVVIAIDSLKGSLSSIEAGMAAKEGILKAKPDAEIIVKPLADGGEGTVEGVRRAEAQHQPVHGRHPLRGGYALRGEAYRAEKAEV